MSWAARWSSVTRLRASATGWLAALMICAVIVMVRLAFGQVLDDAPFVIFFPAVIASSLVGGWRAGLMAIAVSLAAIVAIQPSHLVAGSGGLISSAVFILVAGFDVLLIEGFARILRVNAAQKSELQVLVAQQETMFREMQHRVGNNMQFVASMLATARRRLPKGSDTEHILEQAFGRISSLARLHLKLHDIATYERGLEAVLNDVLAELFDSLEVSVRVRIRPEGISMDQMTALVMIVVEAATNAIKHVFRSGRGRLFEVQLRAVSPERLVLLIRDDGRGPLERTDPDPTRQALGLRIMQGFAQQLQGTLKLKRLGGMTIRLEFPRAPTLAERTAAEEQAALFDLGLSEPVPSAETAA